jgi:arthrofactin-type cyclic lipopeptide synthetase C
VPAAFADLSQLLFGGEAPDHAVVRAVRTVLAAGPPRRLLHVHCTTESTAFASWHRVGDLLPGASGVPIGLPLANTSLHVLDRGGAPAPLGACGELAIGGDGLAQGYWNRPALTAEVFTPHPWAFGERLYRTGDLVRRGAGGAIELLGHLAATRFDKGAQVPSPMHLCACEPGTLSG